MYIQKKQFRHKELYLKKSIFSANPLEKGMAMGIFLMGCI